jgi:hypothetical protein
MSITKQLDEIKLQNIKGIIFCVGGREFETQIGGPYRQLRNLRA